MKVFRIQSLLLVAALINLVHCNQDEDPHLSLGGSSWGTYVTIEVRTESYEIDQSLVNSYVTKFNEDGTLDYSERGVWSKAQWILKSDGSELEIRYPSGDVRTFKVSLVSATQFNYMEYEINPASTLSDEQAEMMAFANRLLILSGKPSSSERIKITFGLKK